MKLSLDVLKPDPDNARKISDAALSGLAVSAETFGDLSGITWNEQLGVLVAGHQRMKVLRAAGATEWDRENDEAFILHPKTRERFAVRIVHWDETTHRMAELTANNQRIQGVFEDELAAAQLAALDHDDLFDGLGLADLEKEIDAALADTNPGGGSGDNGAGRLAERFLVPPFSVLDARQGYWQDRKRVWLALGIKSELGRVGGVTWGDSPQVTEPGLNFYRNDNKARAQAAPGGSPRPAMKLRDGKTERGDGAGRVLK